MAWAARRRAGRHYSLREFVGVVWRKGDRISRMFMALIFVGYVLPLLPAVWLFLTFSPEVDQAYGLVWLSGVLYLYGFTLAVPSATLVREFVRRGWVRPNDEYYLHVARYMENCGKNGRNPHDVAWTVGFWVLWYALLGFAVVYSLALLPILHEWTPYTYLIAVTVPVTAVSLFLQFRRTRRNLKVAESRGYPLERLFPR